jgi:hypothetical protein
MPPPSIIGQQALDAGQRLEELDEGRGVDVVQRAADQRRQPLLLRGGDLLLEALGAVVVPAHRVLRPRELAHQGLGDFGPKQRIEHRVGERVGRGVIGREASCTGREGGRVEHVIHASIRDVGGDGVGR